MAIREYWVGTVYNHKGKWKVGGSNFDAVKIDGTGPAIPVIEAADMPTKEAINRCLEQLSLTLPECYRRSETQKVFEWLRKLAAE